MAAGTLATYAWPVMLLPTELRNHTKAVRAPCSSRLSETQQKGENITSAPWRMAPALHIQGSAFLSPSSSFCICFGTRHSKANRWHCPICTAPEPQCCGAGGHGCEAAGILSSTSQVPKHCSLAL